MSGPGMDRTEEPTLRILPGDPPLGLLAPRGPLAAQRGKPAQRRFLCEQDHGPGRETAGGGQSPLFLGPGRLLLRRDGAGPLPAESHRPPPTPQGALGDLTVISPAQVPRQQGHGPAPRAGAQLPGVLRELALDALVGDRSGGQGTSGARLIRKILAPMGLEIPLDPRVDAALADAADLSHLAGGPPPSEQEHSLQAPRETGCRSAVQRLGQSTTVVLGKAEFFRSLCMSHAPGVTWEFDSCKDFWLPT
jgi:hypothetical protein